MNWEESLRSFAPLRFAAELKTVSQSVAKKDAECRKEESSYKVRELRSCRLKELGSYEVYGEVAMLRQLRIMSVCLYLFTIYDPLFIVPTGPCVPHRSTRSHAQWTGKIRRRLSASQSSHVASARSETRRLCSLERAENVWNDQRKKSGPSRSFGKLDIPMSWQKSEIR